MNHSSNKNKSGTCTAQLCATPARDNSRNIMYPRPQVRPLMPSNTISMTGTRVPFRRQVFRSQIPIRAEPAQPEQPAPFTPQRPTIAHQATAVAISLSEQQDIIQSVEDAFSVYSERLQADLRDFRALCTTLVVKEQHDKERWHSLCLRIMKERDAARQRLHAFVVEQRLSPVVVGSGVGSSTGSRKRSREDITMAKQEELSPAGFDRPISPLSLGRASHSPTRSPPGSPPSYSSLPAPTSAATPPPPTASPVLASSGPSRSWRSCSPTHTEYGKTDNAPLAKRRKSCDASFSTELADAKSRSPVTTPHPSLPKLHTNLKPMGSTSGISLPTGEFSHVDIMYVPTNGNFVCRACLLESTKQASTTLEPKTFPANASWDDLRDHCVTEHPSACVDVARLHPAEVFELRRRLNM